MNRWKLCTVIAFLVNATPSQSQRSKYRIWDASYGNLTCFSCSLDLRWMPFNISDPCLGLETSVDRSNLVRCGPSEIYCKEEFLVTNGVLWTLTRQCTSLCYYGCRPRGFGIEHNTCTNCCSQHGCNGGPPPDLGLQLPGSCAIDNRVSLWVVIATALAFIIIVHH